MTDNMNPLSIGAIVAITLFIIKEVLEAYRKNASKNRKIKALKTILAEEIKLNYWVWKQIESIVKKVKEMPPETLYQIISLAVRESSAAIEDTQEVSLNMW